MKVWLEGKKSYLVAVLMVFATLLLVAIGKLTPETATAVLMVSLGLFAATFRAALERHHEEVLATMIAVSEAGGALATHNVPAALKAGEQAVADGAKLATEIQAENAVQTGASA